MKLRKKTKSLLSIIIALAMVMSLFAGLSFAATDVGGESSDDAIVVGSNGNQANAPRYASYVNESVDGIELTDDVSWHNGLVYYGGTGYDSEGGTYTVSNTTIIMDTDADGSDTSDFGGLGAAVAAIGDGVTLYVSDSYIETTGVAKLALYTDDGAVSIVTNSTLISNGGVIYDGFYSTADTTMMVSPPWVLGLGGDETEGVNARTTNIMGTNSVGVYIDSEFYASGWGALSTDNGSGNTMIVINTYVYVENSGYGAYTIGETTEEYYGATMDVSTYAIIMTGGEATFESYTAGQEVDVYKLDGGTDDYGNYTEGTLVTTVTSSAVVEGTVYSSITSDNFGFMCHSNGSTGYNVINILDGTSITTTDAIFLIKKINAVITVDDATLESTEKGVILQIIDNDDDYIGVDSSLEWGFDDDYGHSYGTHMPSFNQVFSEEDGYANEWIADTAAAALYEAGSYDTADNWTVDYVMTNTDAIGDIWNSSGYVGSNVATTLNVTLGEGASLTGLISAGAFSHDTKYATVGDGDWSGASALGHVTNIVNSNGVNLVNVTLTDDAVWYVNDESYIDTLTVEDNAAVYVAVSLTVGDTTYEAGTVITADGAAAIDTEYVTLDEWLGSWTSGGDEDNDYVATAIIRDGVAETSDLTITDTEAVGTVIVDSESGHNGIIIYNSDYTISDATIIMITDADGSDTCDFSGVGSAIAVYENSVVTIEDSYIETAGVATMPVFVDSGSTVTIINSTLISAGGTLYAEYMNSPDQAVMVAPPWILGIMGTSRTTNLMGTDSTMNVIDSDTYSGAWAVLSTDSGSNMYLNIYNTSLTLMNADESAAAPLQEEGGEISTTNDNPYTENYGSGYGTYAIGAAVEVFAGATVNVGTYATIFTGGSAVYTSLTAGETYTLYSADGENDVTYTATEDVVTVINSDTFGFMVHQDSNTITIEKGTIVNSGYATFLIKTGGGGTVTATIDDAEITNGGVLIQLMDNDDSTNGGMMGTDDELNTNGGSMNFIPYHTENAGFNTENTSSLVSGTQSFTFTNGDYTGNIYNASGSDNSDNGPLSGSTLEVTLGEGATLTGAAASTSFIHVTYEGSVYVKDEMDGDAFEDADEAAAFAEEYQNTYFTIDEYYSIGQVANLINYSGVNDINITLTDDAVWYVDGTSLITSLTIEDDAQVIVLDGATLTVGDTTYEAGTVLTAEGAEEGESSGLEITETEDGLYTFEGQIGSFGSGGDEDYVYVAYAIINGEDVYTNLTGVDADSAVDVVINDSESGREGFVIIDAGEYTISNASIILDTDADGSDTCDFSGVGSAIAVYGDSNVTIEDSYIYTAGVATMPVFTDTGATVTIVRSILVSAGGTLYESYMNSPDQATMVAPPWILGIMGTSRCTNLMGDDSTMNFIDSDTSSGAWAVLSTDSGSNMYLNIYNTSLTLLNADESAAAPLQEEGGEISTTNDNPYSVNYGSGYGTYAIGAAVETFAGATINVGTYATIFTGGSAVYTSITEGETYILESADGETDVEYTATTTAVTTINSDTFGFMVHQDANTITIEEGTIVNSGYATFLIKTGGGGTVTATIDDAVISNGGVLIQLMDNDDSTNGGMMSTDDELNTNGGSMNFIPYHTENAGFNTENTTTMTSGTQVFTFTNGDYVGNIYNASGSDNSDNGPLSASALEVTIGEGATLTGAVASTSFIHVTYEGSVYVKDVMGGDAFDDADEAAAFAEEYQNTYFTIDEYYSIGQVANLINYNGYNDITLTLTDDAVWYVDGTSLVTTLIVEDDAQVVVASGSTLTVASTGVVYSAGTYTSDDFEGVIGLSDITITVGETYQLTPSIFLAEAEDAADDGTETEDAEDVVPDDVEVEVEEETETEDTTEDTDSDSEENPDVADDGTGGDTSDDMLSAAISDGILTITSNGQEMDSFSYTVTAADGTVIESGTIAGGSETTVDVSAYSGDITISASSSTPGPYEGATQEITVAADSAAGEVVALSKDFDAYQQYLVDFLESYSAYCETIISEYGSLEALEEAVYALDEATYTEDALYIYLTSNSGLGRDSGVIYAYDYDSFALQGYNYVYYNTYDADADVVEDEEVSGETEEETESTEETVTGTYEYAVADESVATVTEDGLVTGVAVGETTITVTYVVDGEVLAEKTITVTVVAEGTVIPDETTAGEGDETTAGEGDETTAGEEEVTGSEDTDSEDTGSEDTEDTSDSDDTDTDAEAAEVGDASNLALWMLIAVIAVLGTAVTVVRRRMFN